MWFRVLLMTACAAVWALTRYLDTHVSSDPVVFGRWSKGYFAMLVAGGCLGFVLMLAQGPMLYRRLHAARFGIVALLGSLFGVLVALEVVVRLKDPYGLSYYESLEAYLADMLPDDELNYRHRPGFRATYGGVESSYEEIAGLRERPIGPKTEGEYRVLVLGDSVVYGWGANAEDTFARRLEPLLARRLGRPVRTINAGACSYATGPEFALLKRHGARIDPDLVLLIYVENDVTENVLPSPRVRSLAERSPPEVIGMALGRSWLYRLGVHILGHLKPFPPSPLDREAAGWKKSMASAAGMADWCKERGIPFAIAFWRYGTSDLTDAEWADLSAIARERGFPLADMAPAFAGKDLRKITNSVVDSHPNADGHRIAAERLDEILAPLLPAR